MRIALSILLELIDQHREFPNRILYPFPQSLFYDSVDNCRDGCLRLYRPAKSKHLGGVGEWLKPTVLKTGVHFVDREFESRPLRHHHKNTAIGRGLRMEDRVSLDE